MSPSLLTPWQLLGALVCWLTMLCALASFLLSLSAIDLFLTNGTISEILRYSYTAGILFIISLGLTGGYWLIRKVEGGQV